MTDILIDGAPATVADLAPIALVNYGGFTVMRVEDGAVRGLDLHLARLRGTSIDLFGALVPEGRLRELMRLAVAGRAGSVTLRVNLFSDAVTVRDPSAVAQPRVMTTVSPARLPSATPLRLTTAPYRRESPSLKHAGTFGLIRQRRLAMAAGFDDVLFVDHHPGRGFLVSEGSIWNIGFWQRDTVVWPLAPMLSGTGQALLQRGLEKLDVVTVTRTIRLDEVETFDAAFVVNASEPGRPVQAIGDIVFPGPYRMDSLSEAWALNPLVPI